MLSKSSFFSFLLALSFPAIAHGGQYVVQLAAVKNFDASIYKNTEQFGELRISKYEGGINRVQLGSFNGPREAEEVLKRVKALGFPDAFILSMHGEDVFPANVTDSHTSGNLASHPVWEKLTTEQRENIVILDGVFHLKEDDKFIPLEQLNK